MSQADPVGEESAHEDWPDGEIGMCHCCRQARPLAKNRIAVLDVATYISRRIQVSTGRHTTALLCGECGPKASSSFWHPSQEQVLNPWKQAEDPARKPFSRPL